MCDGNKQSLVRNTQYAVKFTDMEILRLSSEICIHIGGFLKYYYMRPSKCSLARLMECFSNPVDLFHMRIW